MSADMMLELAAGLSEAERNAIRRCTVKPAANEWVRTNLGIDGDFECFTGSGRVKASDFDGLRHIFAPVGSREPRGASTLFGIIIAPGLALHAHLKDIPMSDDTMLELAERADRATGADRALDADIRLLIHGDCIFGALTGNKHQRIGHGYLSGYVEQYRDTVTADDAIPDEIVSRYTASLDAAMTLRLPNMRARIVVGQHYASCELISGWGRARERCIVPTIERADEEIALCIVSAWLRARAAMEQSS